MRTPTPKSLLLLVIIIGQSLFSCNGCKNQDSAGNSFDSNETPLPGAPTKITLQDMTCSFTSRQLTWILRNNDTQPLGSNEKIKICWEISPQGACIRDEQNKVIPFFQVAIDRLAPQQKKQINVGTLDFNKAPEVIIKSWVEVQSGTQTTKSKEIFEQYHYHLFQHADNGDTRGYQPGSSPTHQPSNTTNPPPEAKPNTSQSVTVYFQYDETDLPFLQDLQNKLRAKKYNNEDLSNTSSPSIVFQFVLMSTRIDHFWENRSREVSKKAGGNFVLVRIHSFPYTSYTDDSFDSKLTSGYKGKDNKEVHIVLKAKCKINISNTGLDNQITKELIDGASLETQIRSIVSSMK